MRSGGDWWCKAYKKGHDFEHHLCFCRRRTKIEIYPLDFNHVTGINIIVPQKMRVMKNGSIVSTDLTSHHAKELKEFYQQVIGWESEDLTMKDEAGVYSDYVMKDKAGNWVAGI